MGKWHANQRVILFIGAMVCLFTTPRTLANSKTETSEEANAVEMSPAIATMGINFMTTGAMVGSAWSDKASGALYDGLTVTADIHGAPQWQIIGSGLSGAAIGVGLGYINAMLVPPVQSSTLMAQTISHLALPLAATGGVFIVQPSTTWTGFLYLSSAALTLPVSFLVGTRNISREHVLTGQLFALNLGLLAGGGLATMSPYGPALGLPTLSSRPVDVAVGGFLFAGAVGMVLGPLGQSVLPTHTQKRVSRILKGGLLGSSVGWILGLFLNDTAFTDNDSLNVAPTFGVAGQLLGGIIAGLQKVEEE